MPNRMVVSLPSLSAKRPRRLLVTGTGFLTSSGSRFLNRGEYAPGILQPAFQADAGGPSSRKRFRGVSDWDSFDPPVYESMTSFTWSDRCLRIPKLEPRYEKPVEAHALQPRVDRMWPRNIDPDGFLGNTGIPLDRNGGIGSITLNVTFGPE